MDRFTAALTLIGMLACAASAELNFKPAARVHVRYVDGVPMRFTSKLSHVVELNFTLNFNHSESKPIIDQMLGRIASDYASGPDSAFSLKKFIGPGNGTSVGLPNPIFTLDDLLRAEVIVTNNVSNLNDVPSKSAAAASAMETAVKQQGRGVIGFHASGDAGAGWSFYSNDLHPLDYHATGNRTPAPVYKNEPESRHLVLEGVLVTGTEMAVPMGTDSAGMTIKKTTLIRQMTNEWYKYGRNILSDPRYKPLTTCLLRYDYQTTDLESQYRFPGGNAFSFILKVGAGKSAYIQSGHAADELTRGTSFDGGTGDFERYFAQMLFYLAGYRSEPCGGRVDCTGLPVVDSLDHVTDRTYDGSDVSIARRNPVIAVSGNQPYEGRLVDLRGRTVLVRSGRGSGPSGFDLGGLREGLYFLRVEGPDGSLHVRRYLAPGTLEPKASRNEDRDAGE